MRPYNLALLGILAASGCASVSHGSGSDWRGHSAGVVKVALHYVGESLPERGWLVEAAASDSVGRVRFTKWSGATYRYRKDGFFVVETKWRADVAYLGLLQTRDGIPEFCTLNPEHGAYMEGDRIVHTYSWDYCATLSRR